MTVLRADSKTARRSCGDRDDRGVPEATVARLPIYLRALAGLADGGTATCSSDELATFAGVKAAKLRRDLSYLGSYGTRGVGYDVAVLRHHIARELGVATVWDVVIVGAGNLGTALSTYAGFDSRGINIAAVFDTDPERIGAELAGLPVQPFAELTQVIRDGGICIAVIATPGPTAQQVAEALVEAGISSILNFAPVVLQVPESVEVRKVDLSIELQILAYHEQRNAAGLVTSSEAVPEEVAR